MTISRRIVQMVEVAAQIETGGVQYILVATDSITRTTTTLMVLPTFKHITQHQFDKGA